MLRSPLHQEKCSSEPDIHHLLAHESGPSLDGNPKPKRRRITDSSQDSKLDQILSLITKQDSRLSALEGHISDLKAQSSSIQSSNTEIIRSIENVTEQISLMQEKINFLETKRQDMSADLVKLEEKIDRIERGALKTSIEIRQVPKTPKESKNLLYTCFETLLSSIDLPLERSLVRDIFRLPSKTTETKSTLVVEFTSTLAKTNFLNCVKRKNKSTRLNTKDLGIEGDQDHIFISEHLTAKARRLHYLAREIAKSGQYAFCWTANGQVFLRKSEGEPHILVKSETQLNNIKNLSNPVDQ